MLILRGVNLLLMVFLMVASAWAQPANDACGNALALCPSQIVSSSNLGATATVCTDCEDDFHFCFTGKNSVWFTFTTNTTGGDVSVDISNIVFLAQASRGNQLQAIIVKAAVPCDASTFTAPGNCVMNATGNFTLSATGLPASTVYYVIVNGAMNGGATLPAQATFDISASGTGVDRLPVAISISGPGAISCPDQALTFNVNLTNCTDTSAFTWKVNGVLTAVTTDPVWQTSEIKDGDIVSLECSCFVVCPEALTTQYGPITVENLTVDAGPDQFLTTEEGVILSGTSSSGSHTWTPSVTVANPSALTTGAIPKVTTTYFLTAHSANCTLSDEVVIHISDQFVIPGSFSPNGDGTNDKWVIEGVGTYPNAHVTVFDRWGQIVLNEVGYSLEKSWDGTHEGKAVTDGVYFYVIDLTSGDKDRILKGSVTIIR